MERQLSFSPVGSFIFFWWPFFHFSRAFDLISDVTETSGDAPSGEEAQFYSMNDLSERGEREVYDQSNPTKVVVPSALLSSRESFSSLPVCSTPIVRMPPLKYWFSLSLVGMTSPRCT